MSEASSRLWRLRNLGDGLHEMLIATIELLGADMGNVQLLDAKRRVLRIANHSGFEADFLEFFREVSIEDDSACGRALRAGERIVIDDVETDAGFAPMREVARAAGFRAVQSTPLIGRDGALLGMISTHFRVAHRPSEQELRCLDLYARQASDFIERCRIDAALRESELRFRSMANAAPTIIWTAGPDGIVTWASERWFKYTGVSRQDDPKRWPQVLHPDDIEPRAQAWRTAIAEGREYAVEVRHRRHDGVYRWFVTRAAPIFDASGRVVEWCGSTTDIDDQKQAEQSSREREARRTAILDTALDGIITIDEQGRIVEFNAAAEQIFGYSRKDVVGHDMAGLVIPARLREQHRAGLARYLATGEAPVLDRRVELTAVRRDGTEFPIEVAITRITSTGPPLFTGYLRDITDRKRAQERQLLFINELNHRVKNTLAIVQSIVAQTLRSTERSADARELLEGRLGMLSRAHEVLTQHSWEGADLNEIVMRAVEPFETSAGRIEVEGGEVHLTPKQALAFAMTLHELATNAAKYGALSNDFGSVRIAWSIVPAEGGCLHLSWVERDGPAVVEPVRRGFGSRIIERNLARELGGRVSLDYRPRGVVCTIECPVAGPTRFAQGETVEGTAA